jgi:hypothetical protein
MCLLEFEAAPQQFFHYSLDPAPACLPGIGWGFSWSASIGPIGAPNGQIALELF